MRGGREAERAPAGAALCGAAEASARPRVAAVLPWSTGGEGEAEVLRSLESIAAQRAAPVEIVLIADDVERGGALVERLAARAAIDCLALPGASHAALIERGLLRCRAPFLTVVEPGDELAPVLLAEALVALDARPELAAVLVGGAALEGEGSARSAAWPLEGEDTPEGRLAARSALLLELLCAPPLPWAGAVLRRECVQLVGGLDASFALRPEHDLWLRLACRCEVARLARPLARTATAPGAARAMAVERSRAVVEALARSGVEPWIRALRGGWDHGPAARADAHLELARRLLASRVEGMAPFAHALVSEARRLGAAPSSSPEFAELLAQAPELARDDVAFIGGEPPWPAGTIAGPPDSAPPLPLLDALELRVGVPLRTAREARATAALLEHAAALCAAGLEVVLLCPREQLPALPPGAAEAVRIAVLVRDEPSEEVRVLAERFALAGWLTVDAPHAEVPPLAGLPVLGALPSELADAGVVPFVERIRSAAVAAGAADARRALAALERRRNRFDGERRAAALAREARRALRTVGEATSAPFAAAAPETPTPEAWRALPEQAAALRGLAEWTRDQSARTLDKLRLQHRLRAGVRAVGKRLGLRRAADDAGRGQDEIGRFLATAAENSPFLWVVYTTDPYSETRGQRSTWLARELVARGHCVVFFYWRWEPTEPFVPSGHPLVLQLPIDQLASVQLRLLGLDRVSLTRALLIEFPDRALFEQINLFNAHGFVTIYDCVDDWQEFARAGHAHWYDADAERYLARHADVVLATQPLLAERLARLGGRAVPLLPNALDPASLSARPAATAAAGEIVVGYFGHLTGAWFDWPLLCESAARHPAWRFEVIGYGEPGGLELPANIALLGKVEHAELPLRTRDWTVGIIPFREGRLTAAVDPIKLYEYLALGLPVVAVGMPHLAGIPGVFACARAGFDPAIAAAASTALERAAVAAFLERSTWSRRVDTLLEHIALCRQLGSPLKALA